MSTGGGRTSKRSREETRGHREVATTHRRRPTQDEQPQPHAQATQAEPLEQAPARTTRGGVRGEEVRELRVPAAGRVQHAVPEGRLRADFQHLIQGSPWELDCRQPNENVSIEIVQRITGNQ